MSSGLETKPTAVTFDLEDLVEQAWAGHIRVPHFQRPLRWGREDVRRLFDSMVRGYPIGSLLLWVRPAPAETLKLGVLTIDAPASGSALWVVDGQQRIISLASALHKAGAGDPRFALSYDLRDGHFVTPPSQHDPRVIPLPVLFDLDLVLQWFADNPEIAADVRKATAITKILRTFKVPAYQVVQDKPEVLEDIFDRMNNFGKRLSRSEIFAALFAGAENRKDETLTFNRIAAHLDQDLGFGVLDNGTVMNAVLGRRGPDVAREIRTEFRDPENRLGLQSNGLERRAVIEFPDEDRDTAYRLGEEALNRAVRFLQNDAGVPHVSMLPYRHLLIVLTRLFAHFPEPDDWSLRLLRRWFWRAALIGPGGFRGSTTGAIRLLNFAIRPGDLTTSVQNLLQLVDRPEYPLPDLNRFRANEAATKMVLCAWWAREPRSLETGEVFDRAQLADCLTDRPTAGDAIRYVMPRLSLPEQRRLWAANRVLMPQLRVSANEIELLVVAKPFDLPEPDWSEQDWERALRTHGITPSLAGRLARDDVAGFLDGRMEILRGDLEEFVRSRCESDYEDTPPLTDLFYDDVEDSWDEPAL